MNDLLIGDVSLNAVCTRFRKRDNKLPERDDNFDFQGRGIRREERIVL